MGLPTRTLGRTGVDLTKVGMGCAWMGADAQGNLDEEAGVGTILTALECGVRFLDTAQGYMNTRSEAIVGRALAAFPERDRVVVQTKTRPHRYRARATAPTPRRKVARHNLGVFRLAPEKGRAEVGTVRRWTAEPYCERMEPVAMATVRPSGRALRPIGREATGRRPGASYGPPAPPAWRADTAGGPAQAG